MKIAIAGGGIGGLTAALCLAQWGHEVVVIERAPAIGDVGAGIQLSPNAMKVFQRLSLDGALLRAGFQPEAAEFRFGKSGKRIFNAPLGDWAARRWGAPYVHIHRADLIDILLRALNERAACSLRLGVGAVGYKQKPDFAMLVLETGETIEADIVIGADGIHSSLRTQMLGPEQPRFTGCVAWRAVAPMEKLGNDVPPPTACVWAGEGAHCVTYQLRGGVLANWVGVIERDDWTKESWTELGTREQALADFAGWHPVIQRLIENAEVHLRWALFDRAPLSHWADGRVALLGDSCHPMLPFMAQGAAMAIEDSWVLARCLSVSATPPAGLKPYQDARLPRTAKVQAASRANADLFHLRGLARAAYGPMWLVGKVAPALIQARLGEFYAYDPTTAPL
jgi:salicylate hydroxylase